MRSPPPSSTSAIAVWAVLVAATAASWWLGTDHGLHGQDAASMAVVVVAFLKVRVVGSYFMELRHAPWGLRLLFDGWCVMTASVLVIMLHAA